MKNSFQQAFLAVLVLLFSSVPAFPKFESPPEDVPVDRIVRNGKKYIKNNPEDWRGYFALGRVYSLGFAGRTAKLDGIHYRGETDLQEVCPHVFENSFFPNHPNNQPDWMRAYFSRLQLKEDRNEKQLSEQIKKNIDNQVGQLGAKSYEKRTGAEQKLKNMGRKIEPYLNKLRKNRDLSAEQKHRLDRILDYYHRRSITLPNVKKEPSLPSNVDKELKEKMKDHKDILRYFHRIVYYYRKSVEASEKEPDPKIFLALAWAVEVAGKSKEATAIYRHAYDNSVKSELQKGEVNNLGWHGSVALEAGKRLLALAKEHDISLTDRKKIRQNTQTLQNNFNVTHKTPIIVPMTEQTEFRALTEPDTGVSFDMTGNGKAARWTWVSPHAGLLVWDPENEKNITSGRRLFGNVTWWMFWENGFQPMRYLDDNGDGWLSGDELNGLSIWRDKNQNGRSEDREVRPVREWGIQKLNTRVNEHIGKVPVSTRGVVFDDGSVRPTYDWYASKVKTRGTNPSRRHRATPTTSKTGILLSLLFGFMLIATGLLPFRRNIGDFS